MNRSVLLLGLLLAGCSAPVYERQPATAVLRSAEWDAPVIAQTDEHPLLALTLESACALALQRSPTPASADAVLRQAEARIQEARAGFVPTFTLGTSGTLNDKATSFDMPGVGSVTVRPQWQQVWTASSSHTLFDFGRRASALRSAELDADAAALEALTARHRLTHDVSVAWHRVHAAGANLTVSEETLALAERQVQDADALVQAGKRTRDTLLTAAVDLLSRRQDALVARNAHRHALRVLNVLLSRGADAELSLAEPTGMAAAPQPLPAQMKLAREFNPELLAVRARRAAVASQRSATEQGALPEVALNVSAQRDSGASFGASPESAQAVLSVNWPLLDGGRRSAQAAQFSARIIELRSHEELVLQRLETDLSRAVLDLEESLAGEGIARQSVEAATENYRIVNERAAAGTLSAREVLEARRSLAAARYACTEARFRQHSAVAQIAWLTGVPVH